MRRKFAQDYGFVVPEIQRTDEMKSPAKTYQITHPRRGPATAGLRVHEGWSLSATASARSLRATKSASPPSACARWRSRRRSRRRSNGEGFKPIDPISVMLTHLCEIIHNNLARLLSYKDMRALLDRLEPEYKRLLDDDLPVSDFATPACSRF